MRDIDFEVREALPLKVDRVVRVTYQTNRYSVPTQHIWLYAVLLVHPLHEQVELVLTDDEHRRFILEASGARITTASSPYGSVSKLIRTA